MAVAFLGPCCPLGSRMSPGRRVGMTVFEKGKIRKLEPVDNWNKYRVKAVRPNPFEK